MENNYSQKSNNSLLNKIIILELIILNIAIAILMINEFSNVNNKDLSLSNNTIEQTKNNKPNSEDEKQKDGNISNKASFIGYYADIDGDFDGINGIDGIIFADLAFSVENGQWGESGNSSFSYTAKEELNNYCICDKTYTTDEWGTHKVIQKINNGYKEQNCRFYVLSLSDFTETYRTWWQNANKMPNIPETSTDFGTGYTNTKLMLNRYNTSAYGIQADEDMWKLIEKEFQKGWFIPSRDEWSAALQFVVEEYGMTPSPYSYYNIGLFYWTSSQYNSSEIWIACVNHWHMTTIKIDNNTKYGIRLITTF